VRLKLSRQIPLPATSQDIKRGIADLAFYNLLAIPHRELERYQLGVIPNGLASRQRHDPIPFRWPVEANCEAGPLVLVLVLLPTVTDPAVFEPAGALCEYRR